MVNGNLVMIRKRARDPENRKKLDQFMEKSKGVIERRAEMLRERRESVEEVRRIKNRILENFGEYVFTQMKRLRERGFDVMLAKKPIDVTEYIRSYIGSERVGIIPSPQIIEAEVPQAFFVSNGVDMIGSGEEACMHPYIERGEKGGRWNGKYLITSGFVVTDAGVYIDERDWKLIKTAEMVFIIATIDRLFSEEEGRRVMEVMEAASGGEIEGKLANIRGKIILLDNNRISVSRSGMKGILKCINCYSCSLFCPVFWTVGNMFGSPSMGAVGVISTAYQKGIKAAINRGLYACGMCKRCEVECPMGVPMVEIIQEIKRRGRVLGFF